MESTKKSSKESSKPFAIRQADVSPEVFARRFLAGHDFDMPALRKICKEFGLATSGKKNNLLQNIEIFLGTHPRRDDGQTILEHLIRRNKNWFTFRTGICKTFPTLRDPVEIVFSPSKAEWHGPVIVDDDNWYIRPHYTSQWEFDDISKKPQEYQIRWLCFARVSETFVSLHWQGFSLADKIELIDHESQFRYWEYIPAFFDEFQKVLKIKLNPPLLHNLVLHDFWDEFRLSHDHEWEDLRIRAESGGVSLNVKSSGRSASEDEDLNITDIKHLAKTLSLSATKELNISLDKIKQARLEESILRTLIREFGAKSYEFSLTNQGQKLIRAHFYFGMKPNTPSPDSFPHVNCFIKWRSDKDQLDFIIQHLKSGNVESQPQQPSLFG